MKEEIVYSLNGLALVAIFLRDIKSLNAKLFYAQDRLMMTDDMNHEIKSLDVVRFINTKSNTLVLSVDAQLMKAELVSWMEI